MNVAQIATVDAEMFKSPQTRINTDWRTREADKSGGVLCRKWATEKKGKKALRLYGQFAKNGNGHTASRLWIPLVRMSQNEIVGGCAPMEIFPSFQLLCVLTEFRDSRVKSSFPANAWLAMCIFLSLGLCG